MRTVHLGTATDWLRLTANQASPGAADHVIAELQLQGLSASRRVAHHYASGFADLARFFEGLANSWRGWEGVRDWESLEGDLKIEARHAYGHVQFRITVRRDGPGWGNDGWTVTADLTIDPGEQLSNLAADTRSLAGGRHSPGEEPARRQERAGGPSVPDDPGAQREQHDDLMANARSDAERRRRRARDHVLLRGHLGRVDQSSRSGAIRDQNSSMRARPWPGQSQTR